MESLIINGSSTRKTRIDRSRMMRSPATGRAFAAGVVAVSAGAMSSSAFGAVGTWSTVTNLPPVDCNPAAVLTDGSVLCERSDSFTPDWYKLTPDSSGSYQNGTWSQVASATYYHLDNPSAILNDGRYWVAGGENGGGPNHASVEIYDPVANTWTPGPDYPYVDANGQPIGIYDGAASILADGRVMCSSYMGQPGTTWQRIAYVFDPATLTWSDTYHGPTGPRTHEQGFTLLSDGTIFTMSATDSEPGFIYSPATDSWTQKASPAQLLMNRPAGDDEIGAQALLYSGKILVFGDGISPTVAHNNIYDPATDSWANNVPDTPSGLQALSDKIAVVMPNGNVLVDSWNFSATVFYEYDPVANAFSPAPALPTGETTPSSFPPAVMLPNGQVFVYGSPNKLLYTPSGSPDGSWRPVINSITLASGSTYTVSGTQLNGLTSGAVEGDDGVFATNYPLVHVTDAFGRVTYFRTFNFSTRAPAAPGSSQVTSFQFTLPPGFPHGRFPLYVSASGVTSKPKFVIF